MINMDTQKENVTKAAKTVVDSTVSAGSKAVDYSTETASDLAEKAKELLARTKDLAAAGIDRINAVQLGDKNVGERVEETVETVSSAVDVDQLSEQVAKLRDQIDTMLSAWKDSFRPSSNDVKETVKPAATEPATKAEAKTATKKTTAPKATTKKATATKPAAKKPATKAASKPAAKTATTPKAADKKS
ncbi:MAG: hypothetical protein M5U23_11620 [Acidimicrobiia bacterium]|nr:hypothetical protein [Acidimicrobiia bacterium]